MAVEALGFSPAEDRPAVQGKSPPVQHLGSARLRGLGVHLTLGPALASVYDGLCTTMSFLCVGHVGEGYCGPVSPHEGDAMAKPQKNAAAKQSLYAVL